MRNSALLMPLGAAALLSFAMPSIAAKHVAKQLAVSSPDAASWPATKYASMSQEESLAELNRREIPFESVASGARGVVAPVRLKGAVHGVTWHTELPISKRAESPWEIFDARLVLALDDFGAVLGAHGIDDVIIFSSWRPPPKSWPDAKPADRHPGGVAVDAKRFHKKAEGTWLDVLDDFHGRIGATTCGASASHPQPKTAAATELREIACAAAEGHLFHSILTPDFNRAHRNHFHLEVKSGVSWQLVR